MGIVMEKLKERAAPKHTELMTVMVRLYNEQVNTNNILLEGNNSMVDLIELKKSQHKAWIDATSRRFYVSLATVTLTCIIFYLDDAKVIASTFNGVMDIVKGLL